MTKKMEAYGNPFTTTGTRVNSSGETEVKATAGVLERIIVNDNGADCTLTIKNGNSTLGIAPLSGDTPRVIECGFNHDDSIKITLGGSDPATNWYKFDETSGSTAEDSGSEADADLTLYNMEATDWGDGKIGGALDFDGVDEYIKKAAPPPITSSTSPFSISFWMRLDTPATTDTIFKMDNFFTCWQDQYWFRLFIGRHGSRAVYVYWYEGLDNPLFTAGTWYHIVWTWDGSQTAAGTALYVNGERKTLNAIFDNFNGVYNWTSEAFYISYYMDGKMDDFRIYSSVLTQDDADHIYNSGAGRDDDYSMADIIVVYE